jgi:hypothetical protein
MSTTYNDEQVVAIVSFEGAIKREVKRLRERLKGCPDLREFHLSITASGRLLDGTVKLQYSLGTTGYSSDDVKGDALPVVVDEFLRRMGWTQVHAPKAIAYERIVGDDTNPED